MKKALLYLVVAVLSVSILNFWYQFYILGLYYQHAGLFFAILVGIVPLLVVIAAFKSIKYLQNN
jgi:hypothetical protein